MIETRTQNTPSFAGRHLAAILRNRSLGLVEIVPREGGFPAVLSVEITSKCNLRCTMCALSGDGTQASQNAGDIDEQIWERVLEVAPTVGYVNVNGWGENFMNKRFLQCLHQLDALGVATCFTTNGTFLTPPVVHELARLEHLDRINVSIDSPDPEVFQSIRGIRLAAVLRGLEALMRHFPRPEIITVSSVVMAANLESLRRFPDLLASFGVRGYVLQGLVDNGGVTTRDDLLDLAHVAAVIELIRRDCEQRGIAMLVHPFLAGKLEGRMPPAWTYPSPDLDTTGSQVPAPTRQCGAPWDHLFISKEGRVLPCCNCSPWEHDEVGSAAVGDLRQQSFAEALTGETLEQFRTDLLRGALPPVCRKCDVVSTGPHFFNAYSAVILYDQCRTEGHRVYLAVKNTGPVAWTRATRLHVATSRPRNRSSVHYNETWLSPDRVCTFQEALVAPGETAHFAFVISRPPHPAEPKMRPEVFQLVVDGACWLPGTELELRPSAWAPLVSQLGRVRSFVARRLLIG